MHLSKWRRFNRNGWHGQTEITSRFVKYSGFINRQEKHKNLQHVNEHFNYSFSKNLKIAIKYITLNPAGVACPTKLFRRVQHGFIAGRCAPLRFLFITNWAFDFYSLCFSSLQYFLSIYCPKMGWKALWQNLV